MNINRRDAILDNARMLLEANPPTNRQAFMTQLRARLVTEAEMSWQASYYAVMQLERDLRVHGPSAQSLRPSAER